jgi:hypothetical protein
VLSKGATIRIDGLTPEAERIIESAATKCGWAPGVREFLRHAVNSQVACMLSEALLHPKTRTVLIDCFAEYRNPKHHTKAAA